LAGDGWPAAWLDFLSAFTATHALTRLMIPSARRRTRIHSTRAGFLSWSEVAHEQSAELVAWLEHQRPGSFVYLSEPAHSLDAARLRQLCYAYSARAHSTAHGDDAHQQDGTAQYGAAFDDGAALHVGNSIQRKAAPMPLPPARPMARRHGAEQAAVPTANGSHEGEPRRGLPAVPGGCLVIYDKGRGADPCVLPSPPPGTWRQGISLSKLQVFFSTDASWRAWRGRRRVVLTIEPPRDDAVNPWLNSGVKAPPDPAWRLACPVHCPVASQAQTPASAMLGRL